MRNNGKYSLPEAPFFPTDEAISELVRRRYLVEAYINDVGRQVGIAVRGIAKMPVIQVGNIQYILDKDVKILSYRLILVALLLATKNPKLLRLCF